MMHPLCFVLMPFGKKPGPGGSQIDFDAVYRDLIAPAITAAGMEPLRADEEQGGGIIHKPMFERLLLCEYAVADLTTANANVFYELGIRHAARDRSTVLIFAAGDVRLPFDVAPMRALPYRLTPDGAPAAVAEDREALANRLREARQPSTDSPLFTLVEGYPAIDHTKTDVFRNQVQYCRKMKDRLAATRTLDKQDPPSALAAMRAIRQELAPLADQEAGVVVDLFLSFRSVKAWPDMIALVEEMAPPLAAAALVQEQLALALNRAGRGEEAEQILHALLNRRGASSETYGLLGRVYKDRWEAAARNGDAALAAGYLRKAIDAYLKGFEADWRDAYPGVNAVTLMELADPPDPRRHGILPVVAYAVERRIAAGHPDYWDHATRLELAVLAGDENRANLALADALAAVRERWEPETTARNLRLIREARERRSECTEWVQNIENTLMKPAFG